MISAIIDDNGFTEKVRIFSSGLGGIFKELMNSVGEKMTSEAQSKAPRRTGRLQNSINFLFYGDNSAALTTRKTIRKLNVWYAKPREYGSFIEAKNSDYLTFKVNGEWKKVKSVRTPAQPFGRPVWDDYFGDDSSKGYKEFANALLQKIEESLN